MTSDNLHLGLIFLMLGVLSYVSMFFSLFLIVVGIFYLLKHFYPNKSLEVSDVEAG